MEEQMKIEGLEEVEEEMEDVVDKEVGGEL
jgi:hypothetical protein